jgi:hypothetical protein
LRDLQNGDEPLIEVESDAYVATALGRRILAGDGFWNAAPARWIGGTDLQETPYRWDDEARRFRMDERAVSS